MSPSAWFLNIALYLTGELLFLHPIICHLRLLLHAVWRTFWLSAAVVSAPQGHYRWDPAINHPLIKAAAWHHKFSPINGPLSSVHLLRLAQNCCQFSLTALRWLAIKVAFWAKFCHFAHWDQRLLACSLPEETPTSKWPTVSMDFCCSLWCMPFVASTWMPFQPRTVQMHWRPSARYANFELSPLCHHCPWHQTSTTLTIRKRVRYPCGDPCSECATTSGNLTADSYVVHTKGKKMLVPIVSWIIPQQFYLLLHPGIWLSPIGNDMISYFSSWLPTIHIVSFINYN